MNFLAGIIIATSAVISVIIHLEQEYSSYWDYVAFVMVLGGTISVAIMTLPWELKYELRQSFWRIFMNKHEAKDSFLRDCLSVIQDNAAGQTSQKFEERSIGHRILNTGQELLSLGLPTDKVEIILKERAYQAVQRWMRVAQAIRSLAKYPPAFGLAGTVLGLVHLMRGVSEGMSAEETGIRMAIALVATLYGLMVANLFVSPAGELVQKIGQDDERLAEIAIQTVLLAAERESLVASQELLNSFVEANERVDVLGLAGPEGEAEVAA